MRRRHAAPGWTPQLDRHLARRCLYAGAFFYASFCLHAWATSEKFGPDVGEARLASEARVPEAPGVLEPLLVTALEPGRAR